jgi:hypothetical protein
MASIIFFGALNQPFFEARKEAFSKPKHGMCMVWSLNRWSDLCGHATTDWALAKRLGTRRSTVIEFE